MMLGLSDDAVLRREQPDEVAGHEHRYRSPHRPLRVYIYQAGEFASN